ncbi:MAG: hypothetical protein HOH58_15290 [Opitutaceae bacterium]|jgi:hypothetical protein|nr:hypothetical protein [Opitutaceae bacterium]
MVTPMKRVILICLTVLLSGCSSLFNQPKVKKDFWTTGDFVTNDSTPKPDRTRQSINEARYYRVESSPAIKSRAKKYESDGLNPENARAAAEIEYAKSGR